MTQPLRLLILEDSEDDCLLMVQEVREGGHDVVARRVETSAEFAAALAEPWDAILADYCLPSCSANRALALLKEAHVDVPFIIVSGAVSDQQAVRALKQGAHDFLTKDNLAGLVPSLEREIREAENRRQRRLLEHRVRQLADIVEHSEDAIFSYRLDGGITSWNRAAQAMYGYSVQEILDQPVTRLLPADRHQEPADILQRLERGERLVRFETTHRRKDGGVLDVSLSISPLYDQGTHVTGVAVSGRDMASRKEQERLLEIRARQLRVLASLGEQTLRETDLGRCVEGIMAGIADGLQADFVKVLEWRQESRAFRVLACLGWPPGTLPVGHVLGEHESQAGYALRQQHPVVVEDFRTETRFRTPPLFRQHGIISGLSVLVTAGSTVPYGVLGAHCVRPRQFSADDISFFQSVANIFAAAVARRQFEDVLQQAHADLEERVMKRTRELQEANERLQESVNELEQFHDLTVDRELKMIAVEQENERLRNLLTRSTAPSACRLPLNGRQDKPSGDEANKPEDRAPARSYGAWLR